MLKNNKIHNRTMSELFSKLTRKLNDVTDVVPMFSLLVLNTFRVNNIKLEKKNTVVLFSVLRHERLSH